MALLHHWGFRDEVLERMAPWLGRNRPRLVVVNNEATARSAETW
jgi:hypothetical protein